MESLLETEVLSLESLLVKSEVLAVESLLLKAEVLLTKTLLQVALVLESLLEAEVLSLKSLLKSEVLLSKTESLLQAKVLSLKSLLLKTKVLLLETTETLLSLESLLKTKSLSLESLLLKETRGARKTLVESLVQALLLNDVSLVGLSLIDDLTSVNGGLRDVLAEMLLGSLKDGDDSLAVNDGLDFIDGGGVNLFLDDGGALDDVVLGKGCGLHDVLLNVMDDVVIDFTVENGLHFHHTIVSDGLLNDGSQVVGGSQGLSRGNSSRRDRNSSVQSARRGALLKDWTSQGCMVGIETIRR